MFRGRLERLTIVTTATASKEYGKLTYESPDQACAAYLALVSMTRMAAGRPRPDGSLQMTVSKALPLFGPRGAAPAASVSSAHEWRPKPGSQTSSPTFRPAGLRGAAPAASAPWLRGDGVCLLTRQSEGTHDPRCRSRRSRQRIPHKIGHPAAPPGDSDGGAGTAGTAGPDQTNTATWCT